MDGVKQVIETQYVKIVERPLESTNNDEQKEVFEDDLSDTTVTFDDLRTVDSSTDCNRQPISSFIKSYDGGYGPRTEIVAGANLEKLAYYFYISRSGRTNAEAGVNSYDFKVAYVSEKISENYDMPVTFDDGMS